MGGKVRAAKKSNNVSEQGAATVLLSVPGQWLSARVAASLQPVVRMPRCHCGEGPVLAMLAPKLALLIAPLKREYYGAGWQAIRSRGRLARHGGGSAAMANVEGLKHCPTCDARIQRTPSGVPYCRMPIARRRKGRMTGSSCRSSCTWRRLSGYGGLSGLCRDRPRASFPTSDAPPDTSRSKPFCAVSECL